MTRWAFDAATNRYRDLDSGRWLKAEAVTKLRDDLIAETGKRARALAEQVADGDLSPGEFGAEMRKLIKTAHTAQYSLGRGGNNAMTASDRGKLGAALRREYEALDGFVRELQAGEIDAEDAIDRAGLYIDSSVSSFERGKAAARGIELPPDAPPLHLRCRCVLRWEREDGRQVAYWRLGPNPCEQCVSVAAKYQPWIGA